MGQINLYKTSGSAVQTPRTGFMAMFVDENETLRAKNSSGQILPSILYAETASIATSASYAETAGHSNNATSAYTCNTTTTNNTPIAWNVAKYESGAVSANVTWLSSNTIFVLAAGKRYKVEWALPGWFGNSTYYSMTMEYSDNNGSTWQLLRGGAAYAQVANGGGTNWGGGGYAMDVLNGSATRWWRVTAGANSGAFVAGPNLIITLI